MDVREGLGMIGSEDVPVYQKLVVVVKGIGHRCHVIGYEDKEGGGIR